MDIEQQGASRFNRGMVTGMPVLADALRRMNAAGGHDAIDLVAFMSARFPVVRRLVGAAAFRELIREIACERHSHCSAAAGYADSFPRFLRSKGHAASIEYVSDVADLELARVRAERAAHARPLAAEAWLPSCPTQCDQLRLRLHPSVVLVESRFPVVTVWSGYRRRKRAGVLKRWRAESALVVRPFVAVDVWRLPQGGHGFIRALSEGQAVGPAVAIATETAASFDVAEGLALLAETHAVVGIQHIS